MKVLAPEKRPATRYLGNLLRETTEEVEYVFEYAGAIFKLLIPSGFIFDGASIPRFCWTALGVTPGMMEGEALPHDVGYHFKGDLPQGWLFVQVKTTGDWVDSPLIIPKSGWDELLRALCDHFKGKAAEKRQAIYWAVRIFGHFAWYRNDKKRKADAYAAIPPEAIANA